MAGAGVPPTAVVRTLTTGLPKGRIKHPAAFLAHRLTAQLPPLHPRLSLMAIGIGVTIRALPEGTPISVRTLMEHAPESEFEIAAALQELRDHGFLPKA
ncbi:hypothetical protein [Streptomyces sp. MMG1121]|uniref:hypothetical protein n=1 Tax=Streptomyces sp. MMG1121 TaxID=1415544 RepID=UPI0006ADB5C7|nr:hypothetical protein [Streptomyces sp. MMG1121]KOV66202.1 hypothetical protein ADK64_11490 [Streptomyces sp. MMG1121]